MLEIVIMPGDAMPLRVSVGILQAAMTQDAVKTARDSKTLPAHVRAARSWLFEQHFQQFETGHA